MMTFKKILAGVPPSEVFRELVSTQPTLTNADIAELFMEFFEKVDSEAMQVIWHWKSPNREQGMVDDNVNIHLERLLSRAGYLK